MQLLATSFSGAQLSLIISIAVICAVLFAGNAVLVYLFYRKRKRSKLSSAILQQRRDELLEELYHLRQGVLPKKPDEEQAAETAAAEAVAEEPIEEIVPEEVPETLFADVDEEDDDFDESDEDEDDEGETLPEVAADAGSEGDILAVRDMSDAMREKFGFVGDEYLRKRYYVKYVYGFDAKLRSSADEVKDRYKRIMGAFKSYARVNSKMSFRRERVYMGRKTLAHLVFKGKKLCVALALDPAEFENTRYRGEDVSQWKRYSGTPMLLRVTSERRLNNVLYLISQLAASFGAAASGVPAQLKFDLAKKSRNWLFNEGKLKLGILGEAPDLEDSPAELYTGKVLAVKDMSPLMREKLSLAGSEYDNKSYYVRFNYSFEARLRSASNEIKERYLSLINEAGLYKKLNLNTSARGVRLSYRRQTVGLIFFKGKALYVALALEPKAYEETKYRGKDLSAKKRFAATPLALKITSARRLSYAKYLLTRIAEENSIEMNPTPVRRECDLRSMTLHELFAENLVKIKIIGEVPQQA